MSTKCEKEHVSGAERERGSGKSGERERSVEREAAERRAGVTKIGLSGEREIGRSCSAHMLCSDLQGVKIFIFPSTLLVIVTTVLRLPRSL